MRLRRLSIEQITHFFNERDELAVVLLRCDFNRPTLATVLFCHSRVLSPRLSPASCRTASVRIFSMCSRMAERSSDMTLGN